jgi:hypothetical protein
MDIRTKKGLIFIAAIVVMSVLTAVVVSVSAQNALSDAEEKGLKSASMSIAPDVEYAGNIPCSNETPAPDDDIYIISLTNKSDIIISVRDVLLSGDRYEVWVDGNFIGTTPTVPCDGSEGYSSGTFSVGLMPGDHTLQFKNTCEPCFTGDPPCYENGCIWLPSGFFFRYTYKHETPTFTPIGLIALVAMLSAIAALSIKVRKRR